MKKPQVNKGRLLKQRSKVAGQAPPLDEVLRGTLRRRYLRCGKSSCHCKKGRGHGPFLYLNVTLGVGRTRQITIAPGDWALALRYAKNYHRIREVLEAVSTLNRKLFEDRILSAPRAGGKKARLRR
jgi:hypothetical protein